MSFLSHVLYVKLSHELCATECKSGGRGQLQWPKTFMNNAATHLDTHTHAPAVKTH